MHAGAAQADEDAELRRRPLRRRRAAVAAPVVGVALLDLDELRVRARDPRHALAGLTLTLTLTLRPQVRLAVPYHTFERVSGSTSHMAARSSCSAAMFLGYAQTKLSSQTAATRSYLSHQNVTKGGVVVVVIWWSTAQEGEGLKFGSQSKVRQVRTVASSTA